jgi:hypothetical protein
MNELADTLARWQAQGADRLDPVRFSFMSALARRAPAQPAAVQALLAQRLTALVADYGRRLQQQAAPAAAPAAPARSPLALLLDDMHGAQAAASGPGPTAAPTRELKALSRFKGTWTRLQVQQRLAQSEAAVPDKPGPLNSQRLLLQALTQLRTLSPDYLDRCLLHVDTLLWLEQAAAGITEGGSGSASSVPRAAGRTARAARPARPAGPRP